MATVRELVTRLGYSVDDSGAKKYERGLSRLRESADRSATAIRGMLGSIFTAVSLRNLQQTADYVQSLEARIGQLVQTTTDSATAFNRVAAAAIAARQPLQAYGDLYVRLANATRDYLPEQQDVLDLTSTISKTFVVGGLAAQEQAAAMLQLSQAFNKGKLDGDEFRTVMETMPGQITRALAGAMGYDSLQAFYTAREQGELTIEKLIYGFQQLEDDINAQFLAMPMTIGQAFSIVGNRYSRFVAKLNRESGAVTLAATGILEAFDLVEGVLDSVIGFFGGGANTLKTFGIAMGSILGPKALGGLFSLLKKFVGAKGILGAASIAFGLMAEDIYQWATGGKSAFEAMVGPLDEVKERYSNIVAAIDLARDATSKLIQKTKEYIVQNKDSGWLKWVGDMAKRAKDYYVGTYVKQPLGALNMGLGYLMDRNGGATGPQQPAGNTTVTQNTTVNVTKPNATAQEIGKEVGSAMLKPLPNMGGVR